MKKPVKIILLVIGVLIALVIIGNIVKTDVIVERSTDINASVEELTKQTTDFNEFRTWSPWSKMDPNSTFEIKGEQGKVGAEMTWSGNDEVGVGSQVVESITPERIEMKLTFTAPWESVSKVYYNFEPSENMTKITWGYKGEMPLMGSLFVNMDEMLGGQYEIGLAALKAKLEK